MNLEELLIEMFYCLESEDYDSYVALREIAIRKLQERNEIK